MINRDPSLNKTEYIMLRVSEEQKKKWKSLALIHTVTLSKMVCDAMEGYIKSIKESD